MTFGLPVVLLLLAAMSASFLLTFLLRRYALRHRQLLDIPNERSSHVAPTARGGGVAIVLPFVCGVLLLWWVGSGTPRVALALIGAGAATSFVGWLDDRSGLAPHARLVCHFLAAIWALCWLGGFPPLTGEPHGFVYWLGNAVAVAYIVWMLNLYNFMDGIDGIAGAEAITVCAGGIALHLVAAPGGEEWLTVALLASCVAGFLFWNYPPARIFLGDSGSGFLGISLALLSIRAGWLAPSLFWGWTILLGVFIVDATLTLVRRIMRGHAFYIAHRSHAYQYAARKLGKHASVTLAVGAINMLWLLPMALAVALEIVAPAVGLAISYGPLMLLAFAFKAGAEDAQEI